MNVGGSKVQSKRFDGANRDIPCETESKSLGIQNNLVKRYSGRNQPSQKGADTETAYGTHSRELRYGQIHWDKRPTEPKEAYRAEKRLNIKGSLILSPKGAKGKKNCYRISGARTSKGEKIQEGRRNNAKG